MPEATPLTMSAEREAEIRNLQFCWGHKHTTDMLIELDATRAELAEADKIIERVGEESDHFCKRADQSRAISRELAEALKCCTGLTTDDIDKKRAALTKYKAAEEKS